MMGVGVLESNWRILAVEPTAVSTRPVFRSPVPLGLGSAGRAEHLHPFSEAAFRPPRKKGALRTALGKAPALKGLGYGKGQLHGKAAYNSDASAWCGSAAST